MAFNSKFISDGQETHRRISLLYVVQYIVMKPILPSFLYTGDREVRPETLGESN